MYVLASQSRLFLILQTAVKSVPRIAVFAWHTILMDRILRHSALLKGKLHKPLRG